MNKKKISDTLNNNQFQLGHIITILMNLLTAFNDKGIAISEAQIKFQKVKK